MPGAWRWVEPAWVIALMVLSGILRVRVKSRLYQCNLRAWIWIAQ